MKKSVSLLLVLSVFLSVMLLLPVHGEEGIYDRVIRLHVLANSDSDEDQAVKLLVRDAVTEYTDQLLCEVQTREASAKVLQAHLDEIAAVAAQVLLQQQKPPEVRVLLGKEDYPTRRYEKMAFPAGEYLSLRVVIGAGAGQNWWCVLFPPMCLSCAVADPAPTLLGAGLTEAQYRMITDSEAPRYKLRFKILEMMKAQGE